MPTVRDVTFDLLRRLELTTIVGNPGSTEETFLQNLPSDFTYVLALQESSVVGVADGLSQGLKKPVLVNLHTSAGLGNAMGALTASYISKTPLIVTAGQQTREMLFLEPYLTNVEAVEAPRPWVKWSYEPIRPQDVPAAFMRAYITAVQQPTGPVFLSLPLDDWDVEMEAVDVFRTAALRVAPDPERLADFAQRANQSKNPVLIYGGDVARSNAWEEGIAFAEKLQAPVWCERFQEIVPFPHDHPLYAGTLPPAVGPLGQALKGHDLIIAVGACVFRYYPWAPGSYLPEGASVIQVTDDPHEAAKAVAGDSLISDSKIALVELSRRIDRRSGASVGRTPRKTDDELPAQPQYPLKAKQLFGVLSKHAPESYILVNESPSNLEALRRTGLGTIRNPDSYYMTGSGALGWGMPAAVGLALAEKQTGRNRPVIAIIGDGSYQYSPQAVWTAVQHGLHVVFVVLQNEQYAILKAFALQENTPNIPGLDIPGIDIASLGKGYGADARYAKTVEEIETSFQRALDGAGVSVIAVPIDKRFGALLSE
ncbi:MAG: benzoylformate decarboxylase [Desulfovibrionales bacterium]|nr:benzoylformate decarboxylase [Desulfovibrionales bacterium]